MLIDHRGFGDPKRALQLGMGMASPLWSTFFLAAGAGVAYWAWSRWAKHPVLDGVGEAPAAAPEPAPRLKAKAPSVPDLTAPPAATEDTPPAVVPANDAPVEAKAEPAPEPNTAPAPSAAPEPAPALTAEPAKLAKPKAARKPKAPALKAPHPATVIEAVAPKSEHPLAAELAASAAVPDAKPAKPKAPRVKAAALPIAKTSAGPRKAKTSPRASVRRKAKRAQS